MTPAETLHAVGRALYGEQWKSPLARDLRVNERTMRRWGTGENCIPTQAWARMAALLDARAPEIERVRKLVPEMAD